MAPATRAARKRAGAQLPSSAEQRSDEKRNAAEKKKEAAKRRAAARSAAKGGKGGKGTGQRPKQNTAEASESEENQQNVDSSAAQAGNEGLETSAPGTPATKNPEESMTNADYDLHHAIQFELVLGFHQELLIYGRIIHKELLTPAQMHKLKPEDFAAWFTSRRIVKTLEAYIWVPGQHEKMGRQVQRTNLAMLPMNQNTMDQRQRFEGTQRLRYEGWYFQLRDADGVPLPIDRLFEDMPYGGQDAGQGIGNTFYTFVRHEPSVIACEVLQRPVIGPKHVYFKATANPVKNVHVRKGPPLERHDFARILVEHNESVRGIRSRRIAECLRGNEKTDREAEKWSSHGIRLTTPFRTAYRQSYLTKLLQGLNGPPHQKSFFTTTNLCGTSVYVSHPEGFGLKTLQHLAYMLVMYEDQINKLFPPHRRPDINAIAPLDHNWGQRILSNKRAFVSDAYDPVDGEWRFDEQDQVWAQRNVRAKFKSLRAIRRLIFDEDMTIETLRTWMNPGDNDLPRGQEIPWQQVPLENSTRNYLVSFLWADAGNDSLPATIEFRQFEGDDDLANLKWWVLFCRGLVRLANHMARRSINPAIFGGAGYPFSEWSDDMVLTDLLDLMNFPPRGRERLHLRAVFQARRHFAMAQEYRSPRPAQDGRGTLADHSFVRGYQRRPPGTFHDMYEQWWREGRKTRDQRRGWSDWPGDDENGPGDGDDDPWRPSTPDAHRDRLPPESRWPRMPQPVTRVQEADLKRPIPGRLLPSMYDIDRWLPSDETPNEASDLAPFEALSQRRKLRQMNGGHEVLDDAGTTLIDERYADLEFLRIHVADLQKVSGMPANSVEIKRWLFNRLIPIMRERITERLRLLPTKQHRPKEYLDEDVMRQAAKIERTLVPFRQNLKDTYELLLAAINNRGRSGHADFVAKPFTHHDYAKVEGRLRDEDHLRLEYLRQEMVVLRRKQRHADAPVVLHELGEALVANGCYAFVQARRKERRNRAEPSAIMDEDLEGYEAYMRFLTTILVDALIWLRFEGKELDAPGRPFSVQEYHRAWTAPALPHQIQMGPGMFPAVGSPPWAPLPPNSPPLMSSQQLANAKWLWELVQRRLRLRAPEADDATSDSEHPYIDHIKIWTHVFFDQTQLRETVGNDVLEQILMDQIKPNIRDLTPEEIRTLAVIVLTLLNHRILHAWNSEGPLTRDFTYREYAIAAGNPPPDDDYDRLPNLPNLKHLGFDHREVAKQYPGGVDSQQWPVDWKNDNGSQPRPPPPGPTSSQISPSAPHHDGAGPAAIGTRRRRNRHHKLAPHPVPPKGAPDPEPSIQAHNAINLSYEPKAMPQGDAAGQRNNVAHAAKRKREPSGRPSPAEDTFPSKRRNTNRQIAAYLLRERAKVSCFPGDADQDIGLLDLVANDEHDGEELEVEHWLRILSGEKEEEEKEEEEEEKEKGKAAGEERERTVEGKKAGEEMSSDGTAEELDEEERDSDWKGKKRVSWAEEVKGPRWGSRHDSESGEEMEYELVCWEGEGKVRVVGEEELRGLDAE